MAVLLLLRSLTNLNKANDAILDVMDALCMHQVLLSVQLLDNEQIACIATC